MAKQIVTANIVLDGTTDPINLEMKDALQQEYNFLGTATLINNVSVTADLAADAALVPGSQTPSYVWDGLQLVINWYARINLSTFSFNVLGRQLSQIEANQDLKITCTYIDSEGGWKVRVELVNEDRTNFRVTYTEAAALVGANGLKIGSTYIISETGMPNNDGEIQLVAVSSNQFDIVGKHTFKKRAIGAIYYADGGVGSSIDTITVDGNNILTGVIPWNADLQTTIADAVANIVANSGVSGFTAVSYPGLNVIFIYTTTEGATHNSEAVGGTVTAGPSVLIVAGSFNMEQGLELYDLWTNIEYDFNSDTIYSVCDKVGNRWVSTTASSDYKTAPWGVPDVSENKFLQMPAGGCIILGISGKLRNNLFQNVAIAIGKLSGVIENNTVYGNGGYFHFALDGGNFYENQVINASVKVKNTAGGDDVSGLVIENVIFSIQNPGVDLSEIVISGKSTWNEVEFVSNASGLFINTIQSNRQETVAIAANAIDLTGAPEYSGAGIFEISNTGTIDTISNSGSVPDTIILKPAAGTTLTLDPGTATNISIGAITIVLVGNNEDFCVLRRGAAGTNWLVQSFSNF